MYLIYKHTSRTTGKSYIGKTICVSNPNKRWKNGLGYSKKTQPAFYNAIQLYGWDDFDHIILETYISTAKEACIREQYWIAYYHTWIYDPDCQGYNITKGGEGCSGHKVSDETKQKLREARLQQTNLNMHANKGRKYYNNGNICIMCKPGDEPEGFIQGRLLSEQARDSIRKCTADRNTKNKSNLKKTVIIKDGQLKCIGTVNLNKYINAGWQIYQKGQGGKIQHGK